MTQADIKTLPKPGKEEGPIKNLRPITLLNGMRKILSLITLSRIEHKINQYMDRHSTDMRLELDVRTLYGHNG